MTDAATQAPKSRKKTFILLGVIALVLIAVVVGGFLYAASSAGTKASDYHDDFAAWKKKDQPVLLAATAKVPNGTYLRKDSTSPKALAQQKKGCDAVMASRKKAEAAAGRLPTIEATGLLAKISSDYSEAGDTSAGREKVVRSYLKEAAAALAQIERDCQFNIAVNTATTKDDKSFTESTKLLAKNGTEPGVTCDEDACVSSITKKKNKYADLRTKGLKIYRSTTLKLYQSKDCKATSYGAACRVVANAYDSVTKQQLANYAYIRKAKSTVDNPGIDKGNAKANKISERNEPRIKKAVLALDPDLAKNKEIRKYPGWTDMVFSISAKTLLSELKAQRAAIEKL